MIKHPDAIVEKELSKWGEKRRKSIEIPIKKVLEYDRRSLFEDTHLPLYLSCMYYSNKGGDEGLICNFGIKLLNAAVGTEPKGTYEEIHISMQGAGSLSFYGYGERWKEMRDSDETSYDPHLRKILNIPKDKKIFKLNQKKVIDALGIEISQHDKLFKPKEYIQYIC